MPTDIHAAPLRGEYILRLHAITRLSVLQQALRSLQLAHNVGMQFQYHLLFDDDT